MHNSKILIVISFISIMLLLSCSSYSVKDWEKLENRGFHFASFTYIQKMSKKEEAYWIMKNFPVQDIITRISHRYAIYVDSDSYREFIFDKKLDEIKVEGIIFDEYFTWSLYEKPGNRIELSYGITDVGNASDDKYIIELVVYVNNKERDRISVDADKPGKTLEFLYAQIDRRSVAHTDQDLNKYKKTKKSASSKRAEDRLKNALEEYEKNLTPEERKKFRERLMKK